MPSPKSLAVLGCFDEVLIYLLKHVYVPSLEHIEFEDFILYGATNYRGSLNMVLDVICGDGDDQLRRLTLGRGTLKRVDFHAMWRHLKHLETLSIEDPVSKLSADGLFIALSPRDHDFALCP